MKKIKLYTCQAGIGLFSKGACFSVWVEGEQEADDVAILVNPRDVILSEYEGCGDILKIDSVEIA
jgi:hypothetical protein